MIIYVTPLVLDPNFKAALIQYHDYWCPGSWCHQVSSSHVNNWVGSTDSCHHENWYQLPTSFQCYEMRYHANVFYVKIRYKCNYICKHPQTSSINKVHCSDIYHAIMHSTKALVRIAWMLSRVVAINLSSTAGHDQSKTKCY